MVSVNYPKMLTYNITPRRKLILVDLVSEESLPIPGPTGLILPTAQVILAYPLWLKVMPSFRHSDLREVTNVSISNVTTNEVVGRTRVRTTTEGREVHLGGQDLITNGQVVLVPGGHSGSYNSICGSYNCSFYTLVGLPNENEDMWTSEMARPKDFQLCRIELHGLG